ncbi:unnamed protein product [Adineta ricciae]|uniref:Uncharacterized protein n=1 Tax=Adineta ricciae TaxID=249248 RepID=A0A814W7I0_ADIRI|nr:unnamed protein product [Adineta ricciae]
MLTIPTTTKLLAPALSRGTSYTRSRTYRSHQQRCSMADSIAVSKRLLKCSMCLCSSSINNKELSNISNIMDI